MEYFDVFLVPGYNGVVRSAVYLAVNSLVMLPSLSVIGVTTSAFDVIHSLGMHSLGCLRAALRSLGVSLLDLCSLLSHCLCEVTSVQSGILRLW